ncbi:SPOR domain-containing protein [Sphingomonas arantia]|uniref:SPOR domain-containing protein n=1 Tax=Sphingomonas arantia TaxID=1460676 RepID=A0ABW4TWY3_9SPHN
MNSRYLNHVAVCTLATTLLVVGCKPAGQTRVASASGRVPSAKTAAAQFATMGETAMRNRNGALAVAMAERAVSVEPGNARYRAQLGQSYLLAGRFASAIDAFRDAAALAPEDGRTLLGQALAQGALDRQDAARASVAAADGRIGAADRGLALALAGDNAGAIALLEPAARMADATPKTRQNLALAYALGGRWDLSRATAAQDLPADRVDARMQAWAVLAKPQPTMDRVAAFLGVTPVTVDQGMPTQLALGAAPTIAPALMPVAPVAVAAVERSVTAVPEPEPVAMVTEDVAETAPLVTRAVVPDPVATPESAQVPVMPERVAPRVQPRIVPPAMLMRTAYAPVPKRGQWAVQLGAFSSGRSIEAAWDKVSKTVRPVAGMVPLSSTVRARGVLFQRLAVGGLASRGEAVALCEQVRAARGVCFVRTTSGEAPVQMAAARRSATRLASR